MNRRMLGIWTICKRSCIVLCTICLIILAHQAIDSLMYAAPPAEAARIDYVNIVVILLTTVTLVFSVAAIALGIIGAIGFRNLKKEAAKYAAEHAKETIQKSFQKGGTSIVYIDSELRREDGHLRRWMEERVRQEVTLLLPLLGRAVHTSNGDGLAQGEPTDEGEVD